jgi:hypothetical protein
MSRKECKHGKNCCHEICPLDDNGLIGIECSGYEDSGYRRPVLTYKEARERMDKNLLRLKELESIKVTFENGKELSTKIYKAKKSIRNLQRNYYKVD